MSANLGLHMPLQILDGHRRREIQTFRNLPLEPRKKRVQVFQQRSGRVPVRQQVFLPARRQRRQGRGRGPAGPQRET